MSLTFFVNRRFHAGYSLLGRQIRKRVKDEHYAEGIYILALSMIGVGFVLLFFLGWVFWQDLAASREVRFTTRFVYAYSFSQLATGFLFFVTCIWGYKPGLEVALDEDRLTIRQARDGLVLPLRHIKKISSISALEFHRHYRKYVETRSFFVAIPPLLLLLSTDAGPVVLGISAADQKILADRLSAKPEPATVHSAVPVS